MPAHLARADGAHRRLLAAGDQQWIGVATASAPTFFAAERWPEAIEHAEPGYERIARSEDFGPIVQSGMVAARAARLLGDQATEARWLGALAGLEGTATRRAGALYARAMAAREAAPEGAVDLLRQGLEQLADRPGQFAKAVLRQELIESLVASGRHDEAATVFGELVEFWRRVKATWYLGRLEEWARGLGIATTPR